MGPPSGAGHNSARTSPMRVMQVRKIGARSGRDPVAANHKRCQSGRGSALRPWEPIAPTSRGILAVGQCHESRKQSPMPYIRTHELRKPYGTILPASIRTSSLDSSLDRVDASCSGPGIEVRGSWSSRLGQLYRVRRGEAETFSGTCLPRSSPLLGPAASRPRGCANWPAFPVGATGTDDSEEE